MIEIVFFEQCLIKWITHVFKLHPSESSSAPMSTAHYDSDREEVRHFNPHFLHVTSGISRNDQLKVGIEATLRKVSAELKRSITTDFKVNLIHIPDRSTNKLKPVGYGYLWVSNPKVAFMLVGKNPDGTDRVLEKDQPDWKAPPPRKVQTMNELMAEFERAKEVGKTWADIDEEAEAEDAQYVCPKIRISLPPLMTLPKFKYDEEQLKMIRPFLQDQIKREEEKARQEGKEIKSKIVIAGSILTEGTFELSGAHVGKVDEGYSHNVICGPKIPDWVTESQLKAVFSPYASDRVTQTKHRVGGQNVFEAYPLVVINKARYAFITFDPRTQDARFALLMTRRTEVLSRDSRQRTTLSFNQSIKKD